MRRPLEYLLALGFAVPLSATAAPIPFDFTTLGANNTQLATSVTAGGVLAEGFLLLAGTPEPLWLRNQTNDHGIGVCSEGTNSCSSGGGDVNELSNENASSGSFNGAEAIRLTLPTNASWGELWVSSLDDGGSNSNESGILFWSNSPTVFTNSFSFSYNDFKPGVEGNILSLAQASGFDASATYLLFVNDPSNGGNNDYLVWKGVYYSPPLQQAPEPGSLALFGAAFMGLILLRRRVL